MNTITCSKQARLYVRVNQVTFIYLLLCIAKIVSKELHGNNRLNDAKLNQIQEKKNIYLKNNLQRQQCQYSIQDGSAGLLLHFIIYCTPINHIILANSAGQMAYQV